MCSVGRAKLWRLCPAFLQPQRLESKMSRKRKTNCAGMCYHDLLCVIIDNHSVRTDLKDGAFYHHFIIKVTTFQGKLQNCDSLVAWGGFPSGRYLPWAKSQANGGW